MKYRITTNTVEFRIEGEYTYRRGWPWNRYNESVWIPLTCDGGYYDAEEDMGMFDSIGYYDSVEKAQAAIIKFQTPKQPEITRDSPWSPVSSSR